jgi:hypothetical protein
MSEWRAVHRRLVRLEKNWAVHDHPGVNRQLFRSAVLSRRPDQEIEREFRSFGIAEPPGPEWREARDLCAQLDFPNRGRAPDMACDDVYQAALTMMPFGEWVASPSQTKLYRGQRDARWPVVPSFFRRARDNRTADLRRLDALARAITARRPDLLVEQALALIQHYSNELDAPTWLIDLTWDPTVALFFASDGGRTGDIGVVTMLVRSEWENLSAGGRNRLGQIRIIDVPQVLRIERQRALFLDTSHPDLLEQYVAHSVWFRQVDGLVFEDGEAEWPVSKTWCYPDCDAGLDLLRELVSGDLQGAREPRLAPPSDASRALDGNDYLTIARSWCEEVGVALDVSYTQVLAGVCLVHALLQRHREQISVPLRSLHRLRDATSAIIRAQMEQQAIDVSSAMRFTLQRTMLDGERELLESLVMEGGRPPGLGGPVSDLPTYVMTLLAELSPDLAEFVVIGAADASAERVQRDLEAALRDTQFRLFDLRGASDDRGIGALAADIGDAVRLLLVNGDTARTWLNRLAQAFLDGDERIMFERGWVARPRGRSVVVVWYGAVEIGDLEPILTEPIVQFIA